MAHEIIAKVGADLCDLNRRTLLVVCDCFSGLIEVEGQQPLVPSAKL